MARKKLPPELRAKNHTFKLYDWEVEKVKEYIKKERIFNSVGAKAIQRCIELNKEKEKINER